MLTLGGKKTFQKSQSMKFQRPLTFAIIPDIKSVSHKVLNMSLDINLKSVSTN